jgi:hypothetical protein
MSDIPNVVKISGTLDASDQWTAEQASLSGASHLPDLEAIAVDLATRCVYCGDPATQKDHVVPRARGGKNTLPACKPCNLQKASRTPTEWLIAMHLKAVVGNPPDRLHQIDRNIRPELVDRAAVEAACDAKRDDLIRDAWYAFSAISTCDNLTMFLARVEQVVTTAIEVDRG